MTHSLERLRVRCTRGGKTFFGDVKNGRCTECGKLVYVVEVEGGVDGREDK